MALDMIEVKIPEVGESIVEVQIGEWLKAEGDAVRKDEPLAVIESEKANFELPSPASGKLARILSQTGQVVKVGASIGQIEPDGAPAPPPATAPRTPPVAQTRSPKPETRKKAEIRKPHPAAGPLRPSDFGLRTSPAAPSPERGPRIIGPPASPQAQAPTPTAPAREEEVVPMSMLRRTVARRLVEAQRTMAMLTTFNEVDMSAVQALRQQRQQAFQQRYKIKLGLMSFFVKAAIAALKEFPQLNAQVRGEDIIYHNYFDIGVAIATPQGLVVPVLPNAERLSFAEIESAIADFARRAKERQLKPEELAGGTFTITNGGVFGSLLSTPLINPPQSGILGLHAITDRPVAREGAVVVRPMMYLALTYDHRVVDGREAVLFVRRIKEVIEDPARMLIEA